ncbi:hypothetical protein [Marinicellulosiphila megalodicopiae]|uniref:hypothetical protein n=1 Tax=Marinicellulosiphila megalodicopiae TaxID=2724896 RepID=UPI003BB0E8A0
MGTIEWLILFAACCLIIGSFAYIKPTPRQKRQSSIRMKAINSGLKVKQLMVDDLSINGRVNKKTIPNIFFQLHLEEKQKIEHTWFIQRTTGESGIHLPDGWTWKNKNFDADIPQFLKVFLTKQSLDINAIEVHRKYVAISWNEKTNEQYIETLIEDLNELKEFSMNANSPEFNAG